MATVHIVLAQVRGKSQSGTGVPVLDSTPISVQTITSSIENQISSISAPSSRDDSFWQITVIGGDIWGKFGDAPEASAGEDWLILAGQTREFSAHAGEKFALIDV